MANSNSNYFTKEELAIELHVSVATINKWIVNKKIVPIKIGRRALFLKSSFQESSISNTKNNG